MKITNVRAFPADNGNIKAYVSVTFDDMLVVDGFKVISGRNGLFVGCPARKAGEEFKDIAFPITKEFREELFSAVLAEYNGSEAPKSSSKGSKSKKAEDLPSGWEESEWG